jgi:hypothetical protein
VFYGSQTGTAEEFANRLSKDAHRYGMRGMAADPEEYDLVSPALAPTSAQGQNDTRSSATCAARLPCPGTAPSAARAQPRWLQPTGLHRRWAGACRRAVARGWGVAWKVRGSTVQERDSCPPPERQERQVECYRIRAPALPRLPGCFLPCPGRSVADISRTLQLVLH